MIFSRLASGLHVVVATLLLLTTVCASAQTIDDDMHKLINYKRMTAKDKAIFREQRKEQMSMWEKDSIPENFRIPIELISYRSKSARYYTLYNSKYQTGIGFVPSDLAPLYEQEAWRAYKKYGADAPSLCVVLAQQFSESAFNPYAVGDEGKSIGLPQLYRKTARELYKADKQFWSSFFAFNKKGNHYFRNHRMQIRFPFEFLPLIKEYDAQHKIDGLRNYNGVGEQAMAYAEKVMFRSLIYEEHFAKYRNIPIDTCNFRETLFGLINLSLTNQGQAEVDGQQLEQMFRNILQGYSDGSISGIYLQKYYVNVAESNPLSVTQSTNFTVPSVGRDFYLKVEDGQILYNYFADSQQMLDALNHPHNSDFYLYYKSGKKIVKITSFKGVGKRMIYSNVKPGDLIYIPPGTILTPLDNDIELIIR